MIKKTTLQEAPSDFLSNNCARMTYCMINYDQTHVVFNFIICESGPQQHDFTTRSESCLKRYWLLSRRSRTSCLPQNILQVLAISCYKMFLFFGCIKWNHALPAPYLLVLEESGRSYVLKQHSQHTMRFLEQKHSLKHHLKTTRADYSLSSCMSRNDSGTPLSFPPATDSSKSSCLSLQVENWWGWPLCRNMIITLLLHTSKFCYNSESQNYFLLPLNSSLLGKKQKKVWSLKLLCFLGITTEILFRTSFSSCLGLFLQFFYSY